MRYKNSYLLQIAIRSILLALNILFLMYFAYLTNWLFTSVLMSVLFVLQVVFLISYLNRTNKDLAKFLIHLKETDTTLNFNSTLLEQKFVGLTHAFEEVNKKYKEIKELEQRKENLFKAILAQIGTGILANNERGEVCLFNRSLLQIFGMNEVIDLSIMKKDFPDVYRLVFSIKIFKQQIVRVMGRGLLVNMQLIKDKFGEVRVYSFQDVSREINQNELDSWNGLIRVLMHETMNTLTPMSTVVDTMKDCLISSKVEPRQISSIIQKDVDDAAKSVMIIEDRIEGLKSFVNRYRQFVHLPKLDEEQFELCGFLRKIVELINASSNVKISLACYGEIVLKADKKLFEQAVWNIVKNAIEATENIKNPEISIISKGLGNEVSISIRDNGRGIEEEDRERIFIPFFTTKQNGSGIGLSFARQIVFLHGGDILVSSNNEGTNVEITIKKA